MKISRILPVIVFGIVTGLVGFVIGKKSETDDPGNFRTTEASAKSNASTRAGSQDSSRLMKPNLRGYQLSKNPRKGLESLIAELQQSPMAEADFESLFSIWDMLQYVDADEVERLLRNLDKFGSGQEMASVQLLMFSRLASKDGQRAMELAMEQKEKVQMASAAGALTVWMRSEPEAAYQWFQENRDKFSGRFTMAGGFVEGIYYTALAKTDFAGTMNKLDTLEPVLRETIIKQLAMNFGGTPDSRTQLWEELQGDEEALAFARESIVAQMAWQDPREALAFIAERDVGEAEKEKLEEQVISSWSYTEPEKALLWQSERLQGKAGAGDEIAGAFAGWLIEDENEAARWLQVQGEEFKTDQVFRSAGTRLELEGKFERAAAWYEQVLDESMRESHYRAFYQNWRDRDKEAANAWLENLPEADAASVKESLDGESSGE